MVDGDTGQKDIRPPAALTVGYPHPGTNLANIRPRDFYFVGTVNPVRHLLPMVVGLQQLVDRVQTECVIITAKGLVNSLRNRW